MCLGIPYEVVEVLDSDSALLKLGETTRHCFTGLLDGLKEGEWVVLHGGQAIEKLSAAEAQENLRPITLYSGFHSLLPKTLVALKRAEIRPHRRFRSTEVTDSI